MPKQDNKTNNKKSKKILLGMIPGDASEQDIEELSQIIFQRLKMVIDSKSLLQQPKGVSDLFKKTPDQKYLSLIRRGKVGMVRDVSRWKYCINNKGHFEMSGKRKGMPRKFTPEEMTPEQQKKYGMFNMPLMKVEMEWIDRMRAAGTPEKHIMEALEFTQ